MQQSQNFLILDIKSCKDQFDDVFDSAEPASILEDDAIKDENTPELKKIGE